MPRQGVFFKCRRSRGIRGANFLLMSSQDVILKHFMEILRPMSCAIRSSRSSSWAGRYELYRLAVDLRAPGGEVVEGWESEPEGALRRAGLWNPHPCMPRRSSAH